MEHNPMGILDIRACWNKPIPTWSDVLRIAFFRGCAQTKIWARESVTPCVSKGVVLVQAQAAYCWTETLLQARRTFYLVIGLDDSAWWSKKIDATARFLWTSIPRTRCQTFGWVCATGLAYLTYKATKTIRDDEIWDHVASSEDDLGLPNRVAVVPNTIMDVVIARGDSENGIFSTKTWMSTLAKFLDDIGIGSQLSARLKAKVEKRNGNRRGGLLLLQIRDQIFQVRNDVFTKVSREAVREHNELNRLVVARNVEDSMNSLQISEHRRSQIREACIRACFIDTMYDTAGSALLLGPPRRPI